MIHLARQTYESLHPAVRNVAGVLARTLPARVRYGNVFVQAFREAREASWLSPVEVETRVSQRLKALGRAAWRSPYWSERFTEAGVSGGELTLSELRRLEPIDKAEVRQHVDAMKDPAVPEDSVKWVTTGGTTGTPLGLWIDKDASAIDWAYTVAAWERVGFRLDDRRLVLRGVRLGGDVRALTHYEPLRRELYISVFDMDEEHLPDIRKEVLRFAPRFVHGYPSAMETLGRSLRSASQELPDLKALLAVSENLYPGQREYLEQLFGCRLFSFYGMSEKAAFAAECEYSRSLHVEPLYGVIELLDEAGKLVTAPGVRGEIVATALISRAVPLLRYRTGDYGMWEDGACACGRTTPRLVAIEGRWMQEFLVTNSGSKIFMSAVNVHSSVFDRVQRFRFLQRVAGEAVIQLVPARDFSSRDVEDIEQEMLSKLEGQLSIRVEIVDALPLSDRGKHRFIEQLVQ